MEQSVKIIQENRQDILLVSTDDSLITTTRNFLDRAVCQLTVVPDRSQALDFCHNRKAKLVLIDCQGSLEGVTDLLDELGAMQPQCRYVLAHLPNEHHTAIRNQYRRIWATFGEPVNPEVLGHYLRSVFRPYEMRHNRRNHHRYSFNVEIHCTTINPFSNSTGRPHAALMREISRSGASMIIRELVPVPAVLKLSVQLPHQTHPTQILAKSVSCTMTQIPGVYRMGAKFLGLLPPNLAQSIAMISGTGHEEASDIYMGKSFRSALRDWIQHHQGELDKDCPDMDLSIDELADDLASNDENEVIECEEEVLRAQAESENLFPTIKK